MKTTNKAEKENFSENAVLDRLSVAVKKEIDEHIKLLKFDKAIGVNDLDRYEAKALAIRSEIGQYIMQALVTGHQTETTEKKNCAECQTPLISKGRIRRCWYSLAGLVQIFKHKRICPNCKKISYFDPVKNAVGSANASLGFLSACSEMVSLVSFDAALSLIRKHLGLKISSRRLKYLTYGVGRAIADYFQRKSTAEEIKAIANNPLPETAIAYFQVDGAMAPIILGTTEEYLENPQNARQKGQNPRKRVFKENKLVAFFTQDDIEYSTDTEGNRVARIKTKRFLASIGEHVEPVKTAIKKAMLIYQLSRAKTIIFLSDGATWLTDNVFTSCFPGCTRILDWYHAKEHLYKTANKITGNDPAKTALWAKPLEAYLWDGEVESVLAVLEDAAQDDSANAEHYRELSRYYSSNLEAMRYKTFREAGYYIGSGLIESANKRIVKQRLCASGSKWALKNAESMIWLRAKYYEGHWESFWKQVSLKRLWENELMLADVA